MWQQHKQTNVLCRLSGETEAHLADHDRQSGDVDVLVRRWRTDIVVPDRVETLVLVDLSLGVLWQKLAASDLHLNPADNCYLRVCQRRLLHRSLGASAAAVQRCCRGEMLLSLSWRYRYSAALS